MEFSQGEATPSFQSAYYILFANQPLRRCRRGVSGESRERGLSFRRAIPSPARCC